MASMNRSLRSESGASRLNSRTAIVLLAAIVLAGAAVRIDAADRIVGVVEIGADSLPVDASGMVVVGGQRIEQKHIKADVGAPKGKRCFRVCVTLGLGQPLTGQWGGPSGWSRWCPDET